MSVTTSRGASSSATPALSRLGWRNWPVARGGEARATRLALAVFVQMLPATLLSPATRPLFANLHGGDESAMHAFLSLGMLGGALFALALGACPAAVRLSPGPLVLLMVADAVLLALLASPLPTAAILGLRLL